MRSAWLMGSIALAFALATACGSSNNAGGTGAGGAAGTGGGNSDASAGTGGIAGSSGNRGTGGTAGTAGADGGADAAAGSGGADGGAALVARGDYLVNHVAACGDCHTPRKKDGSPDTSKLLAGSPGLFKVAGVGPDGGTGVVSPPNLTPDKTTGLGNWTDDEIKNAFLNGIDDQGKALYPIMPYFVFHNMSAKDADAIVAYLRSIPAVNNKIPERNFSVTSPAPSVPAKDIPDPTLKSSDANYASAMRGKYLAGNIGICMECHTRHDQTAGNVPLLMNKAFAGGEPFDAAALGLPVPPFPPVILSANITPDTTGIAGWTVADVIKVLKQATDPNNAPICPPMPAGPTGAFGGLTKADATDIAHYILNLPGISNTVPHCGSNPGGGSGGSGGSSGSGGTGGSSGSSGSGGSGGTGGVSDAGAG